MRRCGVLAIVIAASTACSSSSSSPLVPAKDAEPDARRTVSRDAAHDSAVHDSGAADVTTRLDTGIDAGHDAGARKPDVHSTTHDASHKDAHVVSPFDAFTYPEAAIPHDAGSDAPKSPCASLPDESSFCAAGDGGTSTGFYVCMQGNAIYSPCTPGTHCVPTDAGAIGIACEKP